jgi:hypothetical protein
VFSLNQKMLDPKSNLEDIKNELEMKITQMKLVAMGDSQVAAAVVANQLLPNNASLALSSAPAGVRAISILSSIKPGEKNTDGTPKYVPQVVGNPDAEESTLRLLKQGLSDLKGGKIKNEELGRLQASNSVNHILKQVGAIINQEGADPRQLKGVAEFFASPEYASFVQSNALDPQAAQTAKKTFQLVYEPAVVNGVQQQLTKTLDQGTSFMGMERQVKKTEPVKLVDAVDIKFSGSGIFFEPKAKAASMPGEFRSQALEVQSLNASQKALNQIIHIGAHMEGNTDYAKYWEEHKHEFVPGYFMKGVKVGDVVSGYEYLGGNASNQKNWKQVKSASTSN